MIRMLVATAAACVIASMSAIPTSACSTAACLNRGIEMRSNFVVKIRYADMPLPGAAVEVLREEGAASQKKLTFTTDDSGVARIADLAPGDYWLEAEYLNIDAAYHCFHVNERPSRRAKHKLAYDWGVLAEGTRRIVGRVVDSQPGHGGTPFLNTVHRIEIPILAANLTLENASTKAVYHASSDAAGAFNFDGIPDGTYVLHLDAGKVEPNRGYDAGDYLLSLGPTAKYDSLLLKYQEAGMGGCGGTSLELQDSMKQKPSRP